VLRVATVLPQADTYRAAAASVDPAAAAADNPATPSSGSMAAARYGLVSEVAVMAPDNAVIETLDGGTWPWQTTPRRTRPWDMAADDVGPWFLLNASVCRLV
jgi:hypothetical protein